MSIFEELKVCPDFRAASADLLEFAFILLSRQSDLKGGKRRFRAKFVSLFPQRIYVSFTMK
ncbi:hypothetical protein [Sedimentisphaera cyanobacteriorum]|uniref:hypothetical protein n=1 Tax=Sedimentisphaera cyanobacteriorum TaxID=1940790 RepID=UPI000F4DAA3F|nr:hypothetical protein [Sedimentisphaera cyanobacteriorum]